MCGIVAIFGYGPRASSVDPDVLAAMRDHMASRGPDGAGSWLSQDRCVGLGHRRLAIIGLGDQGTQPMVLEQRCGRPRDPDRPLAITYNGEIYNFLALREQLETRGHVLRTRCDTEVILHLYEEHGDALVNHLRGMFAFALWDGLRQRLLLARDPYGIKPLYYEHDGAQLRVASQVRTLGGAAGRQSPTPSEASLAAFLLLGYIPAPLTRWEGIRDLPAGCSLVADKSGVHEPHVYFSLQDELRKAVDDAVPCDPARAVRTALTDSVRAHLVADVEVGVFLSAGLDSASILGIAAEDHQDLRAITLGFAEFDGTSSDEAPFASEIARRYRAMHTVATVSQAEFHHSVPALLAAMDQPSIDGVNTWLVSRVASDAGLKVVLSGLGGDEVLGGYASFARIPRWARITKRPASIPGLGRFSRALLQRVPVPGASPKLASVLESGSSLGRLWLALRGLFMPWELPMLLGEERARSALDQLDLDNLLAETLTPDPGTDTGRIAALEGGLYLRNQLLRDSDWASMAHSLEVRFPLVDARLLSQVAPVLVRQQRPGTAKRLLAGAPEPRLPAAVASRGKTGFSVPVGQWLTRLDGYDSWRRVPLLTTRSCPWARRWAYIVAESFGLLGG
jgi:asparagine synthase (glutamine-hydrolysing)